ncbi:hypothetical protein M878_02970 [Streptomyces roseochromogenus subsp. oscitans DS 12.976]|uniref:Uncharacterized protein n=1 Tax=Streptomyces roseochromogenus subsp. oscitans DS 12.976 TaxID=1352936 RepID=V6KVN9_STRRC|nr:hypothetical protein M878_02970 [Streptomyces roseochromogenus subsp. oscitans DS 12.976]
MRVLMSSVPPWFSAPKPPAALAFARAGELGR